MRKSEIGPLALHTIGAVVLVLATSARAQGRVLTSAVQLRVGETRQIAIFGGHRPDCVTGTAPDAIQLVQPPAWGLLAERQGAPSVLRNSLGNTCVGAHLLGTAINHTARRPGTDLVVDAQFRNGRARRHVDVTVTP